MVAFVSMLHDFVVNNKHSSNSFSTDFSSTSSVIYAYLHIEMFRQHLTPTYGPTALYYLQNILSLVLPILDDRLPPVYIGIIQEPVKLFNKIYHVQFLH